MNVALRRSVRFLRTRAAVAAGGVEVVVAAAKPSPADQSYKCSVVEAMMGMGGVDEKYIKYSRTGSSRNNFVRIELDKLRQTGDVAAVQLGDMFVNHYVATNFIEEHLPKIPGFVTKPLPDGSFLACGRDVTLSSMYFDSRKPVVEGIVKCDPLGKVPPTSTVIGNVLIVRKGELVSVRGDVRAGRAMRDMWREAGVKIADFNIGSWKDIVSCTEEMKCLIEFGFPDAVGDDILTAIPSPPRKPFKIRVSDLPYAPILRSSSLLIERDGVAAAWYSGFTSWPVKKLPNTPGLKYKTDDRYGVFVVGPPATVTSLVKTFGRFHTLFSITRYCPGIPETSVVYDDKLIMRNGDAMCVHASSIANTLTVSKEWIREGAVFKMHKPVQLDAAPVQFNKKMVELGLGCEILITKKDDTHTAMIPSSNIRVRRGSSWGSQHLGKVLTCKTVHYMKCGDTFVISFGAKLWKIDSFPKELIDGTVCECRVLDDETMIVATKTHAELVRHLFGAAPVSGKIIADPEKAFPQGPVVLNEKERYMLLREGDDFVLYAGQPEGSALLKNWSSSPGVEVSYGSPITLPTRPVDFNLSLMEIVVGGKAVVSQNDGEERCRLLLQGGMGMEKARVSVGERNNMTLSRYLTEPHHLRASGDRKIKFFPDKHSKKSVNALIGSVQLSEWMKDAMKTVVFPEGVRGGVVHDRLILTVNHYIGAIVHTASSSYMVATLGGPSSKVPLESGFFDGGKVLFLRDEGLFAVFGEFEACTEFVKSWGAVEYEKLRDHNVEKGERGYRSKGCKWNGLREELKTAGDDAEMEKKTEELEKKENLEAEVMKSLQKRERGLRQVVPALIQLQRTLREHGVDTDQHLVDEAHALSTAVHDEYRTALLCIDVNTLETDSRKAAARIPDIYPGLLDWKLAIDSVDPTLFDDEIYVMDTCYILAFGITQNPMKKVIIPWVVVEELYKLQSRTPPVDMAKSRYAELLEILSSSDAFGRVFVIGPVEENKLLRLQTSVVQSILPETTLSLNDDRILICAYSVNKQAKRAHKRRSVHLLTEDSELSEKASAVGIGSSKPPMLF